MSSHLSLATVFAFALARSTKRPSISVRELIAGCYIADPTRFLAFWSKTLKCIESLALECDLIDPVWAYQWKLTQELATELETHGVGYQYSLDAKALLEKARKTRTANKTLDLPQLLLALRGDPRFKGLYSSGFRIDLARDWLKTKR